MFPFTEIVLPKLPPRGWRRSGGAALAALVTLIGALASGGAAEEPPAGPSRHVLVISIDGMGSGYYIAPPAGLRLPHLQRFIREGSFAEAVEGVYPTVTYPSHTTLVTGRRPARHGVYTNRSSRQAGKHTGDWFWFAKAIQVPTLWDEARQHHLTTASVAWPVTAGAEIDWDLPEIWNPAEGETPNLMYVAKFMDPLVGAELLGALGPPPPGADNDAFKARIAAYLLKNHAPNLMLVHFTNLDAAEHASGPGSPAAVAVLNQLDARVGELLEAIKKAGLEPTTDVFVVSDHGFMAVDREIEPNVLLARAGLLTADSQGNVTGGSIATLSNGGSFFIYWPAKANPDWRARIDAALKPLRDQGLVWAVLDRQALASLGADPAAQMALDAPDGAQFGDRAQGPLVRSLGGTRGTHGFLPFRRGLESSFIAWGADIRGGVNLHRIPMTRIGPTVLKAMGIDDPHFGHEAGLADIWR